MNIYKGTFLSSEFESSRECQPPLPQIAQSSIFKSVGWNLSLQVPVTLGRGQ